MTTWTPLQQRAMDKAQNQTLPKITPRQDNPPEYPQQAPVRGIFRHPTPATNLTLERWHKAMERTEKQWECPQRQPEKEEPPMDMIRKQPCTPNVQYSVMNEEMIQNVMDRGRPSKVFDLMQDKSKPDKRYYMDRYATNTSQYLVRGQPGANPWCWLDYQWRREPPYQHDSNRFGAAVKWGREKTGLKTYSHFDGEDVYRYLNIDVYCRPPSNVVERVRDKFGRASSYYHQRRPNTRTWFGSSHVLNGTDVLTDIKAKPLEMYNVKWNKERLEFQRRKGLWPEFSEYTSRFTLRTPSERIITGLQRHKAHIAKAVKQEE